LLLLLLGLLGLLGLLLPARLLLLLLLLCALPLEGPQRLADVPHHLRGRRSSSGSAAAGACRWDCALLTAGPAGWLAGSP
jgi:hypothetical protein